MSRCAASDLTYRPSGVEPFDHVSTGCVLITDDADPICNAAPYRPACAKPLWFTRALALLALGIAVYLLWASVVAGGKVAGCGDSAERGCGHLLTSRWSLWFGVPVSLAAAIVYALTLLVLFAIKSDGSVPGVRRAWQLLLVLAATLIGSACWFLGLQLMLESFCVYCAISHVCGLLLGGFIFWYSPIQWRESSEGESGNRLAIKPAAALSLVVSGLAGTGILIAGQLLVEPRPLDMQVQRMVKLAGGTITLDVEEHPRLGSPQAQYVIVELYDYTCAHCRTMTRYLEQARRRYGDPFAIVPIVVPLNAECNAYAQSMDPLHKHACEYARLALAVWRVKPGAFETFHLWLMESPKRPEAARLYAAELVGSDALANALSDEALDRQLQEHAGIYDQSGGGNLPKLLYGSQTAQGEPANAQQLFDFLEMNVGLRSQKEVRPPGVASK